MSAIRSTLSVVAGVAVLAAFAAVPALAGMLPDAAGAAIAPRTVEVPPGAVQVVCPGPMTLGTEIQGDDITYDPAFDPRPDNSSMTLAAAAWSKGGVPTATTRGIGEDATTDFTRGDADAVQTMDALSIPTVVTAQAMAPATLLGGNVLATVEGGDLAGAAGGVCTDPGTSMFLVGGDTRIGSTAWLVLVNPGQTAVTADVKVWGSAGLVQTVGTSGVLVPPNSQRALALEGIAPEENRIVAEVTATGGDLAGYLQDSRVDGLAAGGIAYVSPIAEPAKELWVAGIVSTGETLEEDSSALLRILTPGSTSAHVTVELYGEKGAVDLPAVDNLEVPAAKVADVPLVGLAVGRYVAKITSSQPIVAGAMSVVGAGPKDREWAAGTPLAKQGIIGAPAGADIRVLAGGDGTITLTAIGVDGAEGEPQTVEVKNAAVRVTANDMAASLGGAVPIAIRFEANGVAAVGLLQTDTTLAFLPAAATAQKGDRIDVTTSLSIGLG